MKIIDERKTKKKAKETKTKNNDRKEQGGGGAEALVEGWKLNDFVVHLS